MIRCYPHIRAFWSSAAANTVVVEADAFKETDVIYRAISSRGHHDDMLQTAELLIGWKDGSSNLLVDPQEIICLEKLSKVNEDANSIYELYPQADTSSGSGFIWDEMVISPTRESIQQELKAAIKRIESPAS
ncbi:hypothetical protein BHE74_00019743 [Ensete ventricosum]|nr:hypothetical protein BHE74_00019743 [Ensete ventricosum]RZR98544.1 hypothetical protein BHM03_00027913 [Ensete ventricosum]